MQCFWFVQPLLSGKDLYLVLVHEGGTGKACCFQLAQLLAELLALRQDGDVVGIAQDSGLAQDGGEVGVLTVEQCDLLLCAGDLITLLEQGYQIPGAKQKIALLYGKDADFTAVLSKAAVLRDTYNVTVLPQGKKLGKQLGQLEAAGFAGAAFMDKDEVKVFAAQ